MLVHRVAISCQLSCPQSPMLKLKVNKRNKNKSKQFNNNKKYLASREKLALILSQILRCSHDSWPMRCFSANLEARSWCFLRFCCLLKYHFASFSSISIGTVPGWNIPLITSIASEPSSRLSSFFVFVDRLHWSSSLIVFDDRQPLPKSSPQLIKVAARLQCDFVIFLILPRRP